MIVDFSQRWREGRASYRPAGETINPLQYDVWRVYADEEVKAFVELHHYSGSYPAARYRFCLWRSGVLVGVAIFSHPSNDATLTSVLPGDALESVELGRLVLLDDVPANGETFFLGECLRTLRRAGLLGVVSFSDPVPRRASGQLVQPGHVGTIYQASNALYVGRGTARSLAMFDDGTVFNARTEQKIRKRERGWVHAVDQLVHRGAAALTANEDIVGWLKKWKSSLTRPVRHAGNLKYVLPLGKGVERHVRKVAEVKPYPKARRSEEGAIVELLERAA